MQPRKPSRSSKAAKTSPKSAASASMPKPDSNGKGPKGPPKPGDAPAPRAPYGTVFTGPTPGGSDKTVATMLGEVVWLMTQSGAHKTFFLSDLEWLAMTPILLKQFRVFYATDTTGQQQGAPQAKPASGQVPAQTSRPVGVAFWAAVNEEVEARLAQGNARLRPQDWRCGDRLWVVDIVAPFGGHEEMLKDLKSQLFKDKTLKFRAVVDGKAGVREM